jgi:lysophospholipase L1-like esterase
MRFLKHITNQKIRLMAVALMVGTLTLDAGVLELRYLVPDTVLPSDSNFVDNPASNGAVMVRLSEEKGKPCDLIFIGASNVEYWNVEGRDAWDKYYAPRHAFNFGVAGDKTENVLWRLDHMSLKEFSPKAAVIFIGLNNFTDTPHAIVLGVDAVMKKTQSIFPGIKILLVSLTPNERDNETVVPANKLIQAYANNETVFYIDIYSKMPREGDNWKGLKPDHLHMTKEGYAMWAEEMEPVLQKILPVAPIEPDQISASR